MKNIVGFAAIAAALFAVPAFAHHSHSMFDDTQKIVMEGTVKEFQWTNPHSWLQVMVTDEKGRTAEWSLEMGAPGGLARTGWRPKTVVPGDKVTVSIHPLKDGSAGGQLLTVVLPNGTKMGE
jgi:translation initiation factor IF-1